MKKNILYIYKWPILIIMIVILLASSKDCYAIFDILKGNKLYKNGFYSDALKRYKSKIIRHPDDQRAIFNAADALYKLEDYTTAIDYYRRALQKLKRKKIKSMIHYNMGNCFYRLGEYEDAVKEYLDALDLTPYNESVKQNLEIAAEKLKNNKNVKRKSQQPSKNSKKEREKNQNPGKKQSKNELPTTNPEQQKTKKTLTEEEAKEIIKSLEEKNQYQLQKIIKNRLKEESNNENGW